MLEEKKVERDELQEVSPCMQPQPQATDKVSHSHAHHSGVLRRILGQAVANRFTSRPIDMEKNRMTLLQQEHQHQQEELKQLAGQEDCPIYNSIRVESPRGNGHTDTAVANTNNHHHYPTLTLSEHTYLESLLESEDPESIRQATLILSDPSLFPQEDASTVAEPAVKVTSLSRRNSMVQRLLFRLHEIGRAGPTATGAATKHEMEEERNDGSMCNTASKRRLGWNERKEGSTILEAQTSMSSLLVGGRRDNDTILAGDKEGRHPEVPVSPSGDSNTSQNMMSWLDGSADVEVDKDDGVLSSARLTAESFFKTSFAILGTAADDASCHPHVLSPPLMESLLEFVPETLSDYHFWIKYSLVRDGANLFTLLRQARASARTILAIETVDGHVFGCFTSRPWRLVSNLLSTTAHNADNEAATSNQSAVRNEEAFYGSNDSFLWKMRQSRFDSQALLKTGTVEEAILMESEMAVYPYTGSNNWVQHCSTDDGIGLGENASAIRLDPSLRSGYTCASETFASPCLLDPKQERINFDVANLEVWTLTPHDTVASAEQEELSRFFQQCQTEENKKLNLYSILVGGPKVKR